MMKAAVLIQANQVRVIRVPIPEPCEGEIRVKLSKVGICGSDVHLFLGHRVLSSPTIIGHEGIGTIDKLGVGVINRNVGARVVIEPNIPCQKCKFCKSNRGNICINKKTIGLNSPGCFTEYVCIPQEFCWHIPDTVSDEDAVLIEPTAVALYAISCSNALPGSTIAVLGLGAIGLLITHLAVAKGYKVLVNELDVEKTNLAISFGAMALRNLPDKKNQIDYLNKIWEENEVEAVFECAGSAETASLATAAAPRGSEIILVGLSEKEATFHPLRLVREGISILPSIIYKHPFDFQEVIQLIVSKVINPSCIISSEISLDNIAMGLQQAAAGHDSKIIVNI